MLCIYKYPGVHYLDYVLLLFFVFALYSIKINLCFPLQIASRIHH
jgi:hypothetical protein